MNNIDRLIKQTYNASFQVQQCSDVVIKKALLHLSRLLVANTALLLKANQKDLAKQAADDPRNDRLLLTEERIWQMARAVKVIASLPCPAGKLLAEKRLPNGLKLQRRSVPLGVVGAIYESRPNVTVDIAALSLRSKNACLLKGSKDAWETNKAALQLVRQALKEAGLPEAAVSLLPPEREVLQQVFTATRFIDVLIPRGSAGLIAHVRQHSLVPVIETGAGVCHIYVEREADLDKAVKIVVNAKVSRPSVCNAMDTLLVDHSIAEAFFRKLLPQFADKKVEIFAAPAALPLLKGYPLLKRASKAHFGREYLSLKCSIKTVAGIDEALQHIRDFSTRHSEAIVSENKKQCTRFINSVDAAVVYTNASTRFTDGEEFGLGAEIGISTQKLHARGPFALEKLVTEKWIGIGNGQVR